MVLEVLIITVRFWWECCLLISSFDFFVKILVVLGIDFIYEVNIELDISRFNFD